MCRSSAAEVVKCVNERNRRLQEDRGSLIALKRVNAALEIEGWAQGHCK